MPEIKVGVVTHYFGRIGVAVVKATDGAIAVGDTIHIKGHTTDHVQTVESLQIEKQPIERLDPGREAGLKVGCHAHEHDVIYKVTP